MKDKPTHEHCWHVTSSYSQVFGGSDMETCCHCGAGRERKWTFEPDPAHGVWVQVPMRVYK